VATAVSGYGIGGALVTAHGAMLACPMSFPIPPWSCMTPMGVCVAANDNWQSDLTFAAQLIAHGLAPSDSSEAGLVVTLPTGAHRDPERQIRGHRDRTSRSDKLK
jgi:hypothetical protein